LIGTFVGVVIIGYGMPGTGDKQTEDLDKLNNTWLMGLTADEKYFIGVFSMIWSAFCMSTVYVSTRQMKKVHYSIIQWNYSFLATFSCFYSSYLKLVTAI